MSGADSPLKSQERASARSVAPSLDAFKIQSRKSRRRQRPSESMLMRMPNTVRIAFGEKPAECGVKPVSRALCRHHTRTSPSSPSLALARGGQGDFPFCLSC